MPFDPTKNRELAALRYNTGAFRAKAARILGISPEEVTDAAVEEARLDTHEYILGKDKTAQIIQFRKSNNERPDSAHLDSLAYFFYLCDLADELYQYGRKVCDKEYWLPCFKSGMPVREAAANF